MKKNLILFILFLTIVVPFNLIAQEAEIIFLQEGIASWYGNEYNGRPTASGEIFDSSLLTAAHPNLPFGTMLTVTNQHNGKKVTVKVNDRGPFVPGRIIDVSRAAAELLDMIITGTAPVTVESVERIAVNFPAAGQLSPVSTSIDAIPVSSNVPSSTVVYVSQPEIVSTPRQINLIPQLNISPEKFYRLQVGSYKIARNAVEAFDRLKSSGLNPAYERFTDNNNEEYFRVVLSAVLGSNIQSTTEKLAAAGFTEAIIREEY